MNSRIIDEWIVNKTKVTVMMCFDGFTSTAYSVTGTIKRSDALGILFESKEKNISFIPYTSIVELELLNTGKDFESGMKEE